MASIRVDNLSKTFGPTGEVKALQSVSCAISENEFFTLLGPSGCGKTTLLRLIAGFELPDEGAIYLGEPRIDHLPPHQRPVNTVFQSYALFPHLSVAENIAFGLQMQGRDRAWERKRVQEMLKLVRLEGLEKRKPQQLSGGQQQRVALARALACEPRLLLLDEPLSALDLKLRKEMQIELKRLQKETKVTFIFVTHDQEEALTMSDRIAVMKDGRILQIGNPAEIYEKPANRYVADFIGDSNFLMADRISQGIYRLSDGTDLSVPEESKGGKVTLSIRPERIELCTIPGHRENLLGAKLSRVTYIGTDTLFDLVLASGQEFRARRQNQQGATDLPAIGAQVHLHLPPSAIRVLSE